MRRSAPTGRPARVAGKPRTVERPGVEVAERASPFTIVGIGASAGGLEALSRLLPRLDPRAGMGYIVVQHLAPRPESILADLLAASSAVPVVQVQEGMRVERNRVHVIPSNAQMTVIQGRLHLAPRPGDRSQHNPIDYFFTSLAQYAESRAIAIVLSGSASDGSHGLIDIKTAGGIAIAQEPKSAKYDGMPLAAIATGVVDLVLTPEQIALELARLADHPFLSKTLSRDVPTTAEPDGFSDLQLSTLFQLLRAASGVDFTHYKLPTIKRRLQRRMLLHRMSSLPDYLRLLSQDPAEVKNLYRDILIHVTRFFRDPDSFVALKNAVFPRLVEEAANKRPIRIWVPGCATGEEAYSVAIALLEHLGDRAASVPVQVFATDVSEEAVEKARAGVYAESITADVSSDRLRRFFTRIDGQYRISKLVRDSCIFARQDLTRDPPFSKLDLILCRNVLIYLGPRLQRRLMGVFHYALKPSGFLMLGATETIGQHSELFGLADKKHRIYTKRAGHATPTPEFPGGRDGAYEKHGSSTHAPVPHALSHGGDIQADVTRLIVSRYGPPAVVVDGAYQIVQTRGKTGAFLELATGEASLNVLKLAREGLMHGLRSALQEARRTLKPTRREALVVRANGSTREVDVHVMPVGDLNEAPHYLVCFESPAHRREPSVETKPAKKSTGRTREDSRLVRMRQELSTSREYLQSIIQDLEGANEELQSANEEILSSNEELQSTNEELDTAKEELQSTNEELNTVNEELNARNEELSHVNSDLINLLTAVPAAIVIVSAELRIRRFTPLAEQILNLIPTAIGRPIGDIRSNLDLPDLTELTRSVIDSVTVRDLTARDRMGRQFSLRIRPYKNQENRIDGAVLAFSEQIDASESLLAERRLMQSILRVTPCGLVVVDHDLRVRTANASALRLFGDGASAVEGKRLVDIADGRLNDTSLIGPLTRNLSTHEPFDGVHLDLADSPSSRIRVDGRHFEGSPPDRPMVLLIVHAVP
jgi:two-component system, chemotaxis family, CheB/CheR fusion protein